MKKNSIQGDILSKLPTTSILSISGAVCSQQVSCHESPFRSILSQTDTLIVSHLCPVFYVVSPISSRSSSPILPIYFPSSTSRCILFFLVMCPKCVSILFLMVFSSGLWVFNIRSTSPLLLRSVHDSFNILLYVHISNASILFIDLFESVHVSAP